MSSQSRRPERLEALHGIAFLDPNLLVLIGHRAVLPGIVGGLLAIAAFAPRMRNVGSVAGLVSMLADVLVVGVVGRK